MKHGIHLVGSVPMDNATQVFETVAAAVGSVPAAWALGLLTMPWLYLVAFVLGSVTTVAGSAGGAGP